jgi:hypothetical protein
MLDTIRIKFILGISGRGMKLLSVEDLKGTENGERKKEYDKMLDDIHNTHYI